MVSLVSKFSLLSLLSFGQWVLLTLSLPLSYPAFSGLRGPIFHTTSGNLPVDYIDSILFYPCRVPTTQEPISLFEAIELEDCEVSINCWFPYNVSIPKSNNYAIMSGKFAL